MLRAVFFDVGNTLLYPYPSVSEVCREVLTEAGHLHDTDAIERLMPLVDSYYEDRFREDDTFWRSEEEVSGVWIGMYSLLCRELGIHEDAEALARRVYEEFGAPARWKAYDDVAPAFERLHGRGVSLGIISNWDQRLEGLLRGLGLTRHLKTVVSSAAVGMHKPDPRVFEYACEMLGVEPREAAHVGDHHYSDIVGATAVGMQAILIDRHGTATADALATLDEIESRLVWE